MCSRSGIEFSWQQPGACSPPGHEAPVTRGRLAQGSRRSSLETGPSGAVISARQHPANMRVSSVQVCRCRVIIGEEPRPLTSLTTWIFMVCNMNFVFGCVHTLLQTIELVFQRLQRPIWVIYVFRKDSRHSRHYFGMCAYRRLLWVAIMFHSHLILITMCLLLMMTFPCSKFDLSLIIQ